MGVMGHGTKWSVWTTKCLLGAALIIFSSSTTKSASSFRTPTFGSLCLQGMCSWSCQSNTLQSKIWAYCRQCTAIRIVISYLSTKAIASKKKKKKKKKNVLGFSPSLKKKKKKKKK